jgi:hypothetical protein
MGKLKKYAPFFIEIIFIIIFSTTKENISKEWIGIVLSFIGIILLFEFIESSRSKKTKNGILSVQVNYCKF